MVTIWQDIRYGFRMLARKPVFTALAIMTLALGIGANTAIFNVVDEVLLRQLPYRNPGQLVQLWQTEGAAGSFPLTGQDFLDWRAQNRTFDDMAVYSFQESFNLSGSGGPERVTGVRIQPNFFSILGIQPVLGRPFLQGDTQARQNLEVLLSYGFWKRHFGGQASAVGSSIELNTEPCLIVGVMPPWYRIPAGGDLWIPIDMTPGIHAAALTTDLPVEGGSNGYVTVDGLDDQTTKGQLVEQTCVTPEYFRALGIPLIRGRGLNGADMDNATAGVRQLLAIQSDAQGRAPLPKLQLVALINQTMARRFWPGQDPTGKIFHVDNLAIQVIGVVGDTLRYGLRQAPVPQAYFAFPLAIGTRGTNFKIVVQTAGPPHTAAGAIRSAVQSLDGRLAVYRMQTMAEFIADSMADDSQQTFLLSTFAGLALFLAAVGTYGVMSYLVTQRTGEIGIRMALGAGRGDVLWMVLREGLAPAIAGIGIGLAATFATSRLLESLLFGIKPNDLLTLAGTSIAMAMVAMMACVIPAMGATRVEPVVALRQE